MVRRWLLSCLTIIQCAAQMGHAGTLQEDLQWYRYSLQFSNGTDPSVDSYLSSTADSISKFRLDSKAAPWAGNFFAMKEGGVAHRWQQNNFPKEFLSKAAARKLSVEERRRLSPIEKYDLLVGNKNFKGTQHEMQFRGPLRHLPPVQDWEGFCNGVRCAGILLPEPKHSVLRKGVDGKEIIFEPADLKALAGASYFYVEKYAQIGSPSRDQRAENQPHPAVFDLALRHGLARGKRPFVIDSNLGPEIWNETVVGYERTLSVPEVLTPEERLLYKDSTQKIKVHLVLETLGEIDIRASNAPTTGKISDGEMISRMHVGYDLYVDNNGKIVDGKWHRPLGDRGVDFAWFVGGAGTDSAFAHKGGNPYINFKTIRKLFSESVQPKCSKIF